MPEPKNGSFSYGRVLKLAFAAVRANWLVLAALAIPFAFLPRLAVSALLYADYFRVTAGPHTTGDVLGYDLLWFCGPLILSAALGPLAASCTQAVADVHGNRRAPAGSLLKTAKQFGFRVALVGLIANAAFYLGLLFLVVPGLLLLVAWAVAGPCLVLENRGILDAFKRSAVLTRGRRWATLGVMISWLAGSMLALFILSRVSDALPLSGLSIAGSSTPALPLARLILDAILYAPLIVLGATIPPALYVELQTGGRPLGSDAADVFT